jgi:hypothetical protein
MMRSQLDDALADLNIGEYVDRAEQSTLLRRLAERETDDSDQPNPERLPRLGFLYESQGLANYQRGTSRHDDSDLAQSRAEFASAFACWRALASLPQVLTSPPNSVSLLGINLLRSELGDDLLPAELMGSQAEWMGRCR